MKQYYQRIASQVLKLESTICAQKARPIVINDLIYQLTFDVINDVGFSITDMDSNHGASAIGGALSIIGPTIPSPWVTRMALALFPGVWRIPHWVNFFGFTIGIVEKRIKVTTTLTLCAIHFNSTDKTT